MRYLALRVASDTGRNRYRLVCPANDDDRTGDLGSDNLPHQAVLNLKNDDFWRPVVSLTLGGSGKLVTDAVGISVEQV